jgi:hypothetical protein
MDMARPAGNCRPGRFFSVTWLAAHRDRLAVAGAMPAISFRRIIRSG